MIHRFGLTVFAVLTGLAIHLSTAIPASAQPPGDPILDNCMMQASSRILPNHVNVVFCPPPPQVKAGQEYGMRVVVLNKRTDQQVHFAVQVLHYANPNQGEEQRVVTVGEVNNCPEYAGCHNWSVTLEPTQQAVFFLNVRPRVSDVYHTQVTSMVTYLSDGQMHDMGGWTYQTIVS